MERLDGLVTTCSQRGLGRHQHLPDARELCPAAAIGEEAIMADAVEAIGKVVEKKASDELASIE